MFSDFVKTLALKIPTHTNWSFRSQEQSGCEGIEFKDIITEIYKIKEIYFFSLKKHMES